MLIHRFIDQVALAEPSLVDTEKIISGSCSPKRGPATVPNSFRSLPPASARERYSLLLSSQVFSAPTAPTGKFLGKTRPHPHRLSLCNSYNPPRILHRDPGTQVLEQVLEQGPTSVSVV